MSVFRNEGEPRIGGLTIQSTCGFHEVVDRLRNVTLKDKPILHPYWMSKITLERVNIEDLYPCALYVLTENLNRVQELRESFLKQGIDPLQMKVDKALVNYSWKGKENCVITPPLIEVSEDDGGIMMVVDGLHRVIKARKFGLKTMIVTKVEDVSVPLPVLPVGWDEVKVVDTIPPAEQKRRYRFTSMDEIQKWEESNQERFVQAFDWGDSFMSRILEREQIIKTYPAPYAPWDYPG